ncbi:MAG: T9SS type A sorting domain-containing protein [Chitinophagaceae bacterium]|nr:T9SS type A sorting domain-containing protein [Chitinophagaceae bacterium]
MFSGFIVNATSNGSITFNENSKSATPTHTLFRNTVTKEDKLILKLSSDSIIWDYATFYLKDDAKENKDFWDGEKLFNNAVNLYSITKNGDKLSIDSRTKNESQEIPLGLITANINKFTLAVDKLITSANTQFFLQDKYLNKSILLEKNSVYDFTTDTSSLSKGENRFTIIQVQEKLLVDNQEFKIFPNPTSDVVKLVANLSKESDVTINIIDLYGKTLISKEVKNISYINEIIPIKNLISGYYTIQIKFRNEQMNKSFLKL